jgi:hypothetical protein
MTTTQVLITIVVLLVIAAIGYGIWFVTRRRALQHRFGPEYDRAVAEGDSRVAVERELRERERRHAELELRDLTPEARTRYTAAWSEIQARFLDEPAGAVRDADTLVTELIAERGYPTGEYEEQVAHLSVEHARTLGHYRDAHEISQLSDRGEATTEQLRQAVVHYRTLFSDLLGVDATPGATPTPTDAARSDFARTDDARADAGRADAGRADAGRADAARADAARADAARADAAAADDAEVRAADVPGQRDPEDVPHDSSRRS